MLELDRRNQQRIMIGDDIIIQVRLITKKYVKLGITAPKNIVIMREEIINRPPGNKQEKKEPVIKFKQSKLKKVIENHDEVA